MNDSLVCMNVGRPSSHMVLMNDFKAEWKQIGDKVMGAVARVGKSGWLILGQEVRNFEIELARYWGMPSAVGCANGLDALEIGLRCLGIQPGDKVLTTPLSAFATVLAVIRARAIPVFIDVDKSGLIDLDIAETILKQNRDIRFFIPVHLYGQVMDLTRMKEIKNRFSLKIVEDCAQSIGAAWAGKMSGSVGDIAATSFYPTKNLGCMGDGGALLTRESQMAETARCLRDYGQSAKYRHSYIGLNSRLDEIQAAILRDALMPALKSFTERRREIAGRYLSEISNPKLRVLPSTELAKPVWHLFPVLVHGDRSDFQEHLKQSGILSAIHYPGLINEQEALTGVQYLCLSSLRRAEMFARQEVSLPIHPFLAEDEIQRVIDACSDWR